ncbi:hypothetical protein VIGAN_01434400 [Vigna angularis var. angularis]|uniref:Uncharacterized protein n=1 Tax=Vigna angularis var. angularis TaxID=157739 RepID=A0A0S3R6Y0_PHAAN|nr:hypothetical protein VIGAN_01434400 [Vigna angularis var. angularis]
MSETMDQHKDSCNFNGLSVITNIDPSPSQSFCQFKIMIDLGKHEKKSTTPSDAPKIKLNSMVMLLFIFTMFLLLCV